MDDQYQYNGEAESPTNPQEPATANQAAPDYSAQPQLSPAYTPEQAPANNQTWDPGNQSWDPTQQGSYTAPQTQQAPVYPQGQAGYTYGQPAAYEQQAQTYGPAYGQAPAYGQDPSYTQQGASPAPGQQNYGQPNYYPQNYQANGYQNSYQQPGANAYYAQQPAAPATTPKKNNPKAIAGLVLGICGLVIPFAGFVLAAIGLILSILAMNEIKKDPVNNGGNGMATAGLVCSIVGVAAGLLMFFFVWLPLCTVTHAAANSFGRDLDDLSRGLNDLSNMFG